MATLAEFAPDFLPSTLVEDVRDIAEQITVRIDFPSGNGSGVIIGKKWNTYTVLTAEHVVQDEGKYEVVTHDGRRYGVNYDRVKFMPGADLAVLEFKSRENYQVATLGNYDLNYDLEEEDRFVFVSGWSGARQESRGKPSRLFTAGFFVPKESGRYVAKDSYSLTYGYELVYNNITAGGVSGGPVLDTRGRVIGIHGRAEGEVTIDEAWQIRQIQLGFSLGVPITRFLSQATQVGMKPELLKIETSVPPPVTEREKYSISEVRRPTEVITNSDDAIDWLNYGNQLWRVKRDEEAIAAFDKAIKLKPDLYQAWYARGLVLLSLSRDREAFESFDRATQIEPRFEPAWRLRGLKLVNMNRYEEALESFDKAIAINSKDYFLHVLRGEVLHILKRYSKARDAYSRAIEINPVPKIYLSRGITHSPMKEYEKEIADYNEAIRLKPDYAEAYVLRGITYGQMEKYQRAIADLNEAIRLKPDYARAYNIRGIVHGKMGNHQKAIADYQKAAELFREEGNMELYQEAQKSAKLLQQ